MKKFFDYQSKYFQIVYSEQHIHIVPKESIQCVNTRCHNKSSLVKQIGEFIKDLEALKEGLKKDEKIDFLIKKHRNYYFNNEEYARKCRE